MRGCAISSYVAEACTVQQSAAFLSASATRQRQIFLGGGAGLILLQEYNILAALTAGSSTRSTQICVGAYQQTARHRALYAAANITKIIDQGYHQCKPHMHNLDCMASTKPTESETS
jgi:hypothetical protein